MGISNVNGTPTRICSIGTETSVRYVSVVSSWPSALAHSPPINRVYPAYPRGPDVAQRDSTADQLPGEEPVSVEFHIHLRSVRRRAGSDRLRVCPDARSIVEHENLGTPGRVDPQRDIESRREYVLHLRVASRVRGKAVKRNLEPERESERARRQDPLPPQRQTPLDHGRARAVGARLLPLLAGNHGLLRPREIHVQAAARHVAARLDHDGSLDHLACVIRGPRKFHDDLTGHRRTSQRQRLTGRGSGCRNRSTSRTRTGTSSSVDRRSSGNLGRQAPVGPPAPSAAESEAEAGASDRKSTRLNSV